jgi:phage tail-like protein
MAINFNNSKSGDSPYGNFNYEVEIDGTKVAGFTQVSGISMEADVMEYQEGGVHDSTHKLPNSLSRSNVQLHRGVTAHDDLVMWISQAMTTKRADAQKDVVVSLNDINGDATWGWKLLGCYPVKWTGPEMTANSSEFAMEYVELSFEDLKLIR